MSKYRVCVFIVVACTALPYISRAQNMLHEAGFYGAIGGQAPIALNVQDNHGFYTAPLIGHLYYSFLTNGVQSLSIFLERVGETRNWDGTWSDVFLNEHAIAYAASVSEHLTMTTVGLETIRNLYTIQNLRFGAGIGVGYALGSASASVTNQKTFVNRAVTSCEEWNGVMISAIVRLRYSVYVGDKNDFALLGGARYWGFPGIGPLGDCPGQYNGPSFRTLHELGYTLGFALGF